VRYVAHLVDIKMSAVTFSLIRKPIGGPKGCGGLGGGEGHEVVEDEQSQLVVLGPIRRMKYGKPVVIVDS
jgi:hypothetical protein